MATIDHHMAGSHRDPPYYENAGGTVRPGDILRLSPNLLALKDGVHIGAEQRGRDGRTAKLLGLPDSPPPHADVLEGRRESKIIVPVKLSWAVLLTRGCDIDKRAQRQVAAIRPLVLIRGPDEQAAVIRGDHNSLHYLPEATLDGRAWFPESFVDFRYTMTLDRALFEQIERPFALTRDGLYDLYFGWLRHTMGPQVQRTRPCETCGAPVSVFQYVVEALRPPPDY
jgi:hypothetical protein